MRRRRAAMVAHRLDRKEAPLQRAQRARLGRNGRKPDGAGFRCRADLERGRARGEVEASRRIGARGELAERDVRARDAQCCAATTRPRTCDATSGGRQLISTSEREAKRQPRASREAAASVTSCAGHRRDDRQLESPAGIRGRLPPTQPQS
jgi:hypothetical protein